MAKAIMEDENMKCCGKPMRYQSAETTGLEGETVCIWRFLCMKCGNATMQHQCVIEGRGPRDWRESYRADKAVMV